MRVLDIAAAEVGYLEKSAAAYKKLGASCLYDKTANAGKDNYTKYSHEMHAIEPNVMDFPAAWCDAFVDWCFVQAYGAEKARKMIGGFDDYTKLSVAKYKALGRFFQAATVVPQPGDQIFFSKNGQQSGVYHTGLVERVANGLVYTIEGNTSEDAEVVPNGGAVCRKAYKLSNSKIYGYGRPLYDDWSWVRADGKWYYQDAEGRNTYGWALIKETAGDAWHWYHFDQKGAAETGLIIVDGCRYYMQEGGSLECALCTTNGGGALTPWYVYR